MTWTRFPHSNMLKTSQTESQPAPPPLLRTQIYRSAGAQLSNYISEPWEYDTQGSLETKLQN